MDHNNYKEVRYDEYCKICKHEEVDEKDKPCFDCLLEPAREGSERPVRWEKKEK